MDKNDTKLQIKTKKYKTTQKEKKTHAQKAHKKLKKQTTNNKLKKHDIRGLGGWLLGQNGPRGWFGLDPNERKEVDDGLLRFKGQEAMKRERERVWIRQERDLSPTHNGGALIIVYMF